jgi:hypothetical protein
VTIPLLPGDASVSWEIWLPSPGLSVVFPPSSNPDEEMPFSRRASRRIGRPCMLIERVPRARNDFSRYAVAERTSWDENVAGMTGIEAGQGMNPEDNMNRCCSSHRDTAYIFRLAYLSHFAFFRRKANAANRSHASHLVAQRTGHLRLPRTNAYRLYNQYRVSKCQLSPL